MGGGVDLFELSYVDLGIDPRGTDVGMSQHGLDKADVAPFSNISLAMVWRNKWQRPVLLVLAAFTQSLTICVIRLRVNASPKLLRNKVPASFELRSCSALDALIAPP